MARGLLTARLLGGAHLSLDPGGPVHPPTRKALSLIASLSLEGRAPRAHLAGLLWSEFYDDTSRKNLRQELHRLAGTPLGPYLALTPEEVGLQGDVETDVDRFRRLARQGALEEALDLYGGPLLAGLDPHPRGGQRLAPHADDHPSSGSGTGGQAWHGSGSGPCNPSRSALDPPHGRNAKAHHAGNVKLSSSRG